MKFKDYPNPKFFISWGKGLQSTTMAVMSCLGDIKKVDAIITAETGWEHPHTYEIEKYYIEFFKKYNVPFYKVQYKDIHTDVEQKYTDLPLWGGEKGGAFRRRCTSNYKVLPIRNKIRELMGFRADNKGRTPSKAAYIFLGISLDEAERMADSHRNWIVNEYPLIDLKMSRKDCEKYLVEHNLPVPLKSSCVICPFKSLSSWFFTKKNYPVEWDAAVEFDKKYRLPPHTEVFKYPSFLSKKLKPLDELDFDILEKELPEDICDSGYCFV